MMDDPSMDLETLTGTKSQARIDEEHLNLLTLFHYVVGGIIAAFSSIFIIHIVMGLTLVHHPNGFPPPPSAVPTSPSVPTALGFPPEMGYMIAAMGTVAVLGGWTLGGLTAYAGKCIKGRSNFLLVLIVAGLNCVLVMPMGTVKGVCTFVVLSRPSVKPLFSRP